nr:vegetative cell wall protein gp1-like [Aegilops tauschii subsp. strangulata]
MLPLISPSPAPLDTPRSRPAHPTGAPPGAPWPPRPPAARIAALDRVHPLLLLLCRLRAYSSPAPHFVPCATDVAAPLAIAAALTSASTTPPAPFAPLRCLRPPVPPAPAAPWPPTHALLGVRVLPAPGGLEHARPHPSAPLLQPR